MEFKVVILGSGAAVPTSSRNPSAHYVVCRDRHILIDCAEGTQMRLRENELKFQKIDYILISHLHGDHYFGLVGLLSTMHLLGRTRPINIYGPEGLKGIVDAQLTYGGAKLGFDVIVNTIDVQNPGLIAEDRQIEISHFPLSHKIPTSGFVIREKELERRLRSDLVKRDGVKIEYYHRLKKGEDVLTDTGRLLSHEDYTEPNDSPRSYAYCSDTKYHEAIVPYIQGVDLLYHEATFVDAHLDRAKNTKHSTARQAALIAQKAEVGKLIVGHISARYKSGEEHLTEAKSVFENSIVVEDNDVFVV